MTYQTDGSVDYIYIKKYSFSLKTINEMKIVSTDCVKASSMNYLKTKFTNISEGRM